MAVARPRPIAPKPHLGQKSWRIVASEVEAYVTQTGGMLGPVTFDRRGKKIAPYSVAPWATDEVDPQTPNLLKALRGDFFCLPFGNNATPFQGERHPYHGQAANDAWQFESLTRARGETTLHLSLRNTVRRGRIDKTITLRDGENAVYCRHVVSEMSGPMDLGHHAMLRFPDEEGSGAISTSPTVYGQVYPDWVERPEEKGYQSLKPGATFDSLSAVPMISGETADLTQYPARRGWEDLVMVVADPSLELAWTAVAFPKQRYVWFALRDPKVLASTILWISNGGRHYAPWSGRHVNVMGLEDVTAYFHYGVAESSKPNPVSGRGYKTALRLDPKRPLTVSYVMAVASIPAGFDRVKAIEPDEGRRAVTLRSASGKAARALIDVKFVTGKLHDVGLSEGRVKQLQGR